MLTREENRWNFRCLKFLSDWNFLPISVDENSGKISGQKVVYKLYLWYFFFGLESLHRIYGFVRFLQLLFSPNLNQMMDHLFIHSLNVPVLGVTFWNYPLFIKRPQETIMLFNQLFNNNKNHGTRRKILTWDMKYNLQELITLSIPFVVIGAGCFMTPILLSDPDRMWILYSSVPQRYRHWSLFLLLTSIDVFSFCRILASAFFAYLNQLLFFQKCDMTFQSFLQNFRNQIELPREQMVQNLLTKMQSHFLYVHLFNRVHAYIIFTWKQLALITAIFCAFFAIRYNLNYPFTAMFAMYLHVGIMIVYSVMYEKAFLIPENWRKVKSQLRVSAALSTIKKYPAAGKAAQFQKEIQRIPEIGVKVGDFHVLERASTPHFIGFVFTSVASLLITFR